MTTGLSLVCFVCAIEFLTLSRAAIAQGIPCRYEVAAVIQGPPCGILATITTATAINNVGTVVGHYRCQAGNPRPFKWTQAGGLELIPLPSWLLEASPADVNDHNIMVGTGVGPVAGQRGFVCDLNTGVWTELLSQNPPIGWSGATGINNSNVVCGWRSIDDGGDPVNPQTAFAWSEKDGFTDLGLANGDSTFAVGITDTGVIAGQMGSQRGVAVPFIWDGGSMLEGPTLAGFQTRPSGMGQDGTVLGFAAITPGFGPQTRAFAWAGGPMTNLGTLNGFDRSTAHEGNASVVVGNASHSVTGAITAAIWLQGQIRRLQDMAPTSITFSNASDISTTGEICAVGNLAGSVVSVVMAPVIVFADIDGDCSVEIDDLLEVISAWGPHVGPTPADLNGDQQVDVLDLLIVIDQWT